MMKMWKYDLDYLGSIVLRVAMGLMIAAELLGLGVVFYLATFVRYVADDFCEVALLRTGPVLSVIYESYTDGSHRSANRFTKFLLVDWSQYLGKHDVQLLPVLLIVVWVLSVFWIIHEIRKMIGVQHSYSVDFFLALSLVFFSILQSPNLFQIFFWRSSSLVHFGPVVLFLLVAAFIAYQIRISKGNVPSLWAVLLVFLASFVIGGAGESPTVLMVSVHLLLVLFFWWYRGVEKRPGMILILSGLAGTLLALCGLFLAPANFSHGETSLLVVPVTLAKSLKYTFDFVKDTFLTLPVPTLVSVALPGLLFFALYTKSDRQALPPTQKRRLEIVLLLLPVLGYLLIAAAFASSAYGQSYPAQRVRFSGRFVMTAMMIFEGALLGVWLAQIKFLFSQRRVLFPVAVFLLLIAGFYPLRSSLGLLNSNVDTYRAWSSAWDARNEFILQAVANGTTDLVIDPIESIAGVGELKIDKNMWLNRCVARYYGLESIRSTP